MEQEKLRARLLNEGASGLADLELLFLLLGAPRGSPAVRHVAEALLEVGGGLKALCQEDPQELCARTGLGRARAAQLLAALELGRRAQAARDTRPRLKTPKDIYHYLLPHLAHQRRELFHVLCFNGRNVLLKDVCVAEGTMNSCPVDPREVFRAALGAHATAIVLAHNHPSGDAEPSVQDLTLTRQLISGARLLNIRVLDHLVLGDGEYTSFMEKGLLPEAPSGHGRWQAANDV